ncbi:hypothetical protein P3S68_004048 [Capsicum galapagoense]
MCMKDSLRSLEKKVEEKLMTMVTSIHAVAMICLKAQESLIEGSFLCLVCIPINPKNCDEFDPSAVPTLSQISGFFGTQVRRNPSSLSVHRDSQQHGYSKFSKECEQEKEKELRKNNSTDHDAGSNWQ